MNNEMSKRVKNKICNHCKKACYGYLCRTCIKIGRNISRASSQRNRRYIENKNK